MDAAGSVRTLVTTNQTICPHKHEEHDLPCAIAQAMMRHVQKVNHM